MNTIREIEKINQQELDRGIAGTSASWHSQFLNSAWIYVGNLDHQLTEGDVLCVMSQYGEIEDIHLVREEETGNSRGFGFLKYEDARSCVLAVDNLSGASILGRSLRVDHVEKYRLPKKLQEQEENGEISSGAGHAYEGVELENEYNVHKGMDLFAAPTSTADDESKAKQEEKLERLKRKEERQRKRQEKEERRRRREERREKHEERRRRKRARKHRYEDDDSEKISSENEMETKSRKEKYGEESGDDGYRNKKKRDRKGHRSSGSHRHEKGKRRHSSTHASTRVD